MDEMVGILDQRFPGLARHVEQADLATPATYEHWTGNWQGSYQGWLPTPRILGRRLPYTLPGLENFYMAGQWVETGGGLPRPRFQAVMSRNSSAPGTARSSRPPRRSETGPMLGLFHRVRVKVFYADCMLRNPARRARWPAVGFPRPEFPKRKCFSPDDIRFRTPGRHPILPELAAAPHHQLFARRRCRTNPCASVFPPTAALHPYRRPQFPPALPVMLCAAASARFRPPCIWSVKNAEWILPRRCSRTKYPWLCLAGWSIRLMPRVRMEVFIFLFLVAPKLHECE